MDREAHVENSSSQNVNQDVFGRIERGAAGKGLMAVSPGDSSFFIPKSLAEMRGLSVGQELSEDDFNELRSESERIRAQSKAVDLLARREHSVQELRQKLLQRDFEPALVEQVLLRMQELGYLDDLRFSLMWINSRLRRQPESPMLLKAALMRRGISRQTAEEAVLTADIDRQEILIEAFERAARKSGDREKLSRTLQRRGFSYGEVRRLLDERLRPTSSDP